MNSAETDIIIRIPQNLYDENIQDFIDYIEYKKTVSKSEATQEDIDKLVDETKKERKPKIEALLKKVNINL
ncbi:MAG: hypothetical protein JO072_03700 [Parafilimonas sp.]|nr:hypothetical protein [Parafilimonas sp.]